LSGCTIGSFSRRAQLHKQVSNGSEEKIANIIEEEIKENLKLVILMKKIF
jgi:hypothetical protein